ncbi:Glycosyl transferase group 1 OS=Isosphaera pallida (strain ATCC 43644 / DSM 9630 / IS1B) GN=Isop_3198 PE=4 SV=1: Glyco_trans_4_4: Glycos_transf_1 [Gemmata massiliana]|uniref:Glycosyltransferase subfamily 4-like N-terminal domain-containing protein n=1 Tax=Gemmata massiliana TaxID=1210884 RepID=A0A6P2CXN7_9BACT|nr:glycosyltransferase family 4 protein [Gemmata massiliana]VTR93663.1 Glycosyl transferase group 1 OS=Isosphaera pallida (strain ATCC 43644 / DSM 9630 / IS1B) GN=Isop_3198 PE=4 SV=1: Glyco_trans_4_4: Glycos_transf_1 [Gemmata massiliana]
MRILTVTNLYPNPFQPQRATFNREQIRALACEHQVIVISPIAWTDELTARRTGSPPLPHGRRMYWDDVAVEYPRSWFIPRVFRGSYGKLFQWSLANTFYRVAREFRPDIVFATWAYPDGWAAIRLAHKTDLPIVLKVHGSDVLELDKHPSRRKGTIEALQQADRVVAVSRDLATKVLELGATPERIHLIYNGVDQRIFFPGDRIEARQRLGLDQKRPAILYVGNLVQIKGPDILVDACGRLAKQGIEFDLHIVGKGPMRQNLERQAAICGIAGRTRFYGTIPHNHLPDWFRAATMLVLPSRSEGVPNVLLEASACGTQFVASCVGGVPEIAHLGASRLFKPGDPNQLANAIAETLDNPPDQPISLTRRTQAVVAQELGSVFQSAIRKDPLIASGTIFWPK